MVLHSLPCNGIPTLVSPWSISLSQSFSSRTPTKFPLVFHETLLRSWRSLVCISSLASFTTSNTRPRRENRVGRRIWGVKTLWHSNLMETARSELGVGFAPRSQKGCWLNEERLLSNWKYDSSFKTKKKKGLPYSFLEESLPLLCIAAAFFLWPFPSYFLPVCDSVIPKDSQSSKAKNV